MADAIIIKAHPSQCCKCPPFLLMAAASRWCQKETSEVTKSARNIIHIPVHVLPPPPPPPLQLPPFKERFIIKKVGVSASTYSMFSSEKHAQGYF